MADINSVTLVGRLTRDAELKYTNSGTAIASMSLAVNRRVRQDDGWKDEANFFDCTLFGKMAETLQRYLTKGVQIGITGELRQDRWQQDGQSRSKVNIAIQSLQLLGGGRQASSDTSSSVSSPSPKAGIEIDFDDEIPF